jgi:hypothetical protein
MWLPLIKDIDGVFTFLIGPAEILPCPTDSDISIRFFR